MTCVLFFIESLICFSKILNAKCAFCMNFFQAAVANPCLVNNGGCSDECSQTSDGRVCSCKPGFTLDRDGVTCRGTDV